MSTLLFPDVIDASTLGARATSGVFLPVGIEGQAASDGSCNVAQEYLIARPADAVAYFGASSSLTSLINYILNLGVSPVSAVASAKGSSPNLAARQAAWAVLEADPLVRLRLTDDTTQATIAALGVSCDNANLLQNKQVAFAGLAAGLTKAAHIAAVEAINHRRVVLVSPGVIDPSGATINGLYAAAAAASRVAVNNDLSNDLDLEIIPNFAGIELNAIGQPLFLERVVSGVVVNDFEDVLQAGGSPLMTDRTGFGLRITHLRMSYSGNTPGSDTTYDALMTRLIVDQVFVLVRQYCYDNKILQRGNTPATRGALAAGVEDLLNSLGDIVLPVIQSDGNPGYAVSVFPSNDMRQVTVQYQGEVVRGVSTVKVDGQLTITV